MVSFPIFSRIIVPLRLPTATSLFLRLLLIISLVNCSEALAKDYPVNSQKKAQERLDIAQPGDRIIIQNGTYYDFTLKVSRSGTSTKYIGIKAQTNGKVKFKGKSGFMVTGNRVKIEGFVFDDVRNMNGDNRVVYFNGSDNSILTDCAFYKCGNNYRRHIILMGNSSKNNQIRYNYLEDIRGQGIGVIGESSNSGNRIFRNRINGTTNDNDFNGQEPIQIGQSSDQFGNYLNTKVEYNRIENMTDADMADSELISSKTSGNKIRYNTTLYNSPRMGIVLRGGNDCEVRGNYQLGDGIRAYGRGHKITSNYSKNARYGIRLPGGDGGGYSDTRDCLIEYNLVINSSRSGIRIGDVGANDGGNRISDIIIYKNRVKTNGGTMYVQEYSNSSGINWATGSNEGSGNATLTKNIPSRKIKKVSNISTSNPAAAKLEWYEVGPRWFHTSSRTASETKKMPESESIVANSAFRAYPNPTTETLLIEGVGQYDVTLYTLSGRAVLQQKEVEGDITLDVSEVRPGMYIIKLVSDEQPELRRRIIIQ
ncbi:chondroitinase-B domain-containing protein [Tunicatimonas pelagia]|uniref:chondroitinase-B domain-containing protein n=1 Tax=Tunicatimonas pelagia TaxID=931531 RepID=UPI002665D2E6|nr:chondroitinase-B domain-containing protein [Tunicatimonas pelagia]WKN44950.1 chondroitinase-B domain-containing protein [Tunicatimonas pelagia]